MITRAQKRRERRKRAQERARDGEGTRLSSIPEEAVVGIVDGNTSLTITRGSELIIITPTRENPRLDLFEYHPGTMAVRGLTMMARTLGWRLVRA